MSRELALTTVDSRRLLFATVLAAAALVRFVGLGEQPLRIDEAFTLWLTRQPLGEMLSTIARFDIHPPLHYVIQKGWLAVAESDAGFRALSAAFSTLTVAVVFDIGRRLHGFRAGLIAASLLTFSAWHVRYGQDARMYAFEALLVTAALLTAVAIRRGDGRWWLVGGYGLAMGCAMLVHSTSVVYLALSAAYVLAGTWREPDQRRRFLVGLAVATAIWMTWWWALPQQVTNTEQYLTWLTSPSWTQYFEAVRAPYAMLNTSSSLLQRAMDVMVVLLLGSAVVRLRWTGGFLVAWWLVGPTVSFVTSQFRPTFLTRTFLPGSSGLYLLLAVGAVVAGRWLGRRWLPVVIAAPMVLFLVTGLAEYHRSLDRSDFRSAGELLQADAEEDDLVVYVANYAELPVARYGDIRAEQVGLPVRFTDEPVWEAHVTPRSVEELLGSRPPTADVWLVRLRYGALDPRGLAMGALSSELVPVGCHDFGALDIVHFAPSGMPGPNC